ncbi:MAG: methyl-accepting chemotaxis protein [Planctomycetota bacterium]
MKQLLQGLPVARKVFLAAVVVILPLLWLARSAFVSAQKASAASERARVLDDQLRQLGSLTSRLGELLEPMGLGDDEEPGAYETWDSIFVSLDRNLQRLRARLEGTDWASEIASAAENLAACRPIAKELSTTTDIEAAESLHGRLDHVVWQAARKLEDTRSKMQFAIVAEIKRIADDEQRASWTAIAVAVPSVTAIVIALYVTTRSLRQRLSTLSGATRSLAEGDLSRDVPATGGDEIGELGRSFQEMVQTFRRLLAQLHDASLRLGMVSEQIQQTAIAQGLGIQEQVKTVARTKNMTDELARLARTIATNSTDLVNTAEEAETMTLDVRQSVDDLIGGVREIHDASFENAVRVQELERDSEKIKQLATLIDDIADQTQLLALNASVEAARAGPAGRGFAVVAAEIRRLSENSMLSTREVHETVQHIQETVRIFVSSVQHNLVTAQSKVELASRSAERLDGIVSRIQQTFEATTDIQQSTKSQEHATAQLVEAVSEVSKISERISQHAHSLEMAIDSLGDLSSAFEETSAFFKVDHADHDDFLEGLDL